MRSITHRAGHSYGQHVSNRALVLAWVVALVGVGAVCYLAATFDKLPGDEALFRRFQSFRDPWLKPAAIAVSYLASSVVAAVAVVSLSVGLWVGRRRADAISIVLITIPAGLNAGLKELVNRPRPGLSLLSSAPPEGPGFPSGHTVLAVLLYGLLIVMVGDLIKRPGLRAAVQGLLTVAILAVGASRVYLGVHWPSDVLGAYLVGGLSLAAILWVRKRLQTGPHSNFFRR